MKTKSISYKKEFTLPDSTTETIRVDMVLHHGDSVHDVLDKAREIVAHQHKANVTESRFWEAFKIIQNPSDYTPEQLEQAQILLPSFKPKQ